MKDVKVFLERQPADETASPKPARATAIPVPDPPGALGSSQPADFVPLNDVAPMARRPASQLFSTSFPGPRPSCSRKTFTR